MKSQTPKTLQILKMQNSFILTLSTIALDTQEHSDTKKNQMLKSAGGR